MNRFAERVRNAEDRGPLPWWTPTQKTPWVIGAVVEYRRIETDFGELTGAAVVLEEPAVVQDDKKAKPRLADVGETVMIWFKNTVLRNCWNAPSPVGGPAAIGETVGVKRVGERQNSRGQTYPVFQVFVDGRDGLAPATRTPMTQADAIGHGEYGDDPNDYDPSYGDPGNGGYEDDLPF